MKTGTPEALAAALGKMLPFAVYSRSAALDWKRGMAVPARLASMKSKILMWYV